MLNPLQFGDLERSTDSNGYEAKILHEDGSTLFINFGPCSASDEEDITKGIGHYAWFLENEPRLRRELALWPDPSYSESDPYHNVYELYNNWWRNEEDETEGDGPYRPESVSVEEFLAALSLQSVAIDLETGSLSLCYDDGMLFAGHVVVGSITGEGQIEHSGIAG